MSGDGIDELSLEVPKDDVTDTDNLAEYTFEDRWQDVVKIYNTSPKAHTEKISDSGGTALHVAVDLKEEKFVEELVKATITHKTENEALKMENEHGDTPLHVAASRGFAKICKCIIGANKERIDLLSLRNSQGETPLFLAAFNWHKQAFAYLSHISKDIVTLADLVRDNGDSILHCAIQREYFDLAVIIVHCYDFLSSQKNNEQSTPLKVLATRPSAFRSGSNLSWWKRILYHCILVESLDVESALKSSLIKMEQRQSKTIDFPENYATCYDFYSKSLNVAALVIGKLPSRKKQQRDTENPQNQKQNKCTNIGACELISEIPQAELFPPNYATIQEFVRSAYVHALGLSGVELKAVKKMKKNHKWSGQLLKALMLRPYAAFTGAGGRPTTTDSSVDEEMLRQLSRWKQGILPPLETAVTTYGSISTDTLGETSKSKSLEEEKKLSTTPVTSSKMETPNQNDNTKKETKPDEKKIDPKETAFLVAARNGIVEIVNEILTRIPSAIHNTNSKKENVLLVAVMNRQPLVVETLRMRMNEKKELWNNLILAADNYENTILHLAAQALGGDKPWQIAGSALQMMWDIKWFQYIKSLVPRHFYFRSNRNAKTAGEIFKESHKDLVKDGGEWLKDTSQSCSVVAGLVATVSFATASAVPGGTSEETGKPILQGQPAFDVFAISSLIGLCFSVTGLIMFLSILTTRKEAKDFRRDLPLKLLLGLSSLFVSIATMFLSFCTGHFFVLNSKYKRFLFPIYVATCLPVTFYAVAQFPLYYDILKAILTKVPQGSDKGDSL